MSLTIRCRYDAPFTIPKSAHDLRMEQRSTADELAAFYADMEEKQRARRIDEQVEIQLEVARRQRGFNVKGASNA